MHNLDRTLFETGEHETSFETGLETGFETGERETGEYESEQEDFLGILGSLLSGDSSASGETGETAGSHERESGSELESAARLLEVRDEAELDHFIGDLFNRAVGAAKNFAGSPTGKALGDIVKKATKQALPVVGRGIGGWLSPGYADAGARAGRAAGDRLGLELEGLSNEDREFETARALIRFAQTACRAAAKAPRGASPRETARKAAVAAAREHAPGLLAATPPSNPGHRGDVSNAGGQQRQAARSGRWIRQGNSILILES